MRSTSTWEPSLFDVAGPAPTVDAGFSGCVRRELSDGAWVDHRPGWLTGSAALFDELVAGLSWRQPEVRMYGDRVVQPRKSAWQGVHEVARRTDLPLGRATLPDLARLLGRRYGRRFSTVGCNLYRDGADSVAWHRDRIHREMTDAVIAIVSLGAARTFRLRPHGGGPSLGFDLGHGDLLVMGGTCQRTWEHTVPKVRHAAGPRLSVTFRHDQPGRVADPDADEP